MAIASVSGDILGSIISIYFGGKRSVPGVFVTKTKINGLSEIILAKFNRKLLACTEYSDWLV